MKNAPWLLISIIFHAAVLFIVFNIDWRVIKADKILAIHAEYEKEELEPLKEEEPEEEHKEIEKLEEPLEEPEVTDEIIPEEELVEEEQEPIETPINEDKFNDIIGVGGGWNGKFSGKYRRRRAAKRGSGSTQRAVEWGLDWLARHQHPDGFWDCDGFDMQCKGKPCLGRGSPLNDVGVTGLALLAFLGAGETPKYGTHKRTVRKGLHYLCDMQDPEDGCLASKENEQYMYNHAIACLALTEAYGLSQWPVLKKHARMAVEYVLKTQNPGRGWRYNLGGVSNPFERNDVSVTGWMVMCLASAKDFGLPCRRESIESALRYINEMTDSATGRTGYIERGCYGSREKGDDLIWPPEKVEPMTAVGMLCRIFCANILGDFKSQEEMLKKGADLLRKKPPRWDMDAGTIDFYYWYYGSYAMFQMGGRDWKIWKDRMVEAVVDHQETEGCAKGSWDPRFDPWGDDGGRVYSTALCTLCLEVFYRYDNILGARF